MIRRLFQKPEEVHKTERKGISPPIIVDEQGTATIFEFIEDAERYLEPIDVKNGEYVAYDSEGRLLRLLPTSPRITVESAESEPSHTNEVKDLLIRLLRYTGAAEETLTDETISGLVSRSLEYKTR